MGGGIAMPSPLASKMAWKKEVGKETEEATTEKRSPLTS